MSDDLLIFVGYSQDAKAEATAIRDLKIPLQETLRQFNRVASTRSVYSSLDIFNWEADADLGVGGQRFAVSPYLDRAAIAIFVFRERIGAVTWEELNNCRNRPKEKRIPTFALFPSEPPAGDRLCELEVARAWAELLARRHELTEDWAKEESRSVTPLELYRNTEHLKEIVRARVNNLIPSLVISNRNEPQSEILEKLELGDSKDGNYLDSLAPASRHDVDVVQRYRSLMRDDARLTLPADLSDEEFLVRAGYRRSGKLTIAGALLFSRKPFDVIPSALIRCSKYDGDNKATGRTWRNCDGPLIDQIIQARDFIAETIGKRERPVDSSMQSITSYEYPMVCVREILANAVCHRDYADNERLIYVTLYTDRLEIQSPGSWVSKNLPEGARVELNTLNTESIQRNMRLAHAISSVGMMEVAGSGIPTAIRDCKNCHSREPTVQFKDGYVVVTIYPIDDWHSELEHSPKRLVTSTTQPLPSGNSSDLLAWQLRQWFEALEYPLDVEPETGPDYTDLIVRIPARRRQYTRTLVRAIAGEIQSPNVDLAHAAAKEKSLDEVWLVSLRRVSPAAREAAKTYDNVLLYTLDELIEEDVDFDRYFEWLDTEVQAAEIDRFYVPLAVTVNEIDDSGTLRSNSTHEDISNYVDQWMEDTDGEHLSLLGEFGTGKSWFAFKYAHDLVGKYRQAQQRGLTRPRVPLLIRLREYARGFKDVGALLTEFVFREHQVNIRSFAVLETLNRMGRLLFIFDGFDEMAARVDQQKMVDNFWSLTSVLGPGSKAILTCRTEYFQFAKQAREVLSGNLRGNSMKELFETTRFQVASLEMFDEARLRTVLSRRSDDEKLIEAVLSNQRLIDLGRRPVMVDLLIEAMPSLEAENADLAKVYYQAVQRKMERDISLGRTFTSMADKIFFMCEISWEMLSTRELKIHYKQIPDRIREYFGSSVATAEEVHWSHDLLSQTMLVRDDDGYYRPAHKSLIEFFSAYKLAAAIGALKEEYVEAARKHANVDRNLQPAAQQWSVYFRATDGGGQVLAPLSRFAKESTQELEKTWARVGIDDATSEFIFLMCGQNALLRYVKDQTSSDEIEGIVAARALEIAAFSGDLQGADLAGAVIRGCALRNCNLNNADLSRSSWLEGGIGRVSFEHALLRGASFRDLTFIDVILRDVDLSDSHFMHVGLYANVIGGIWCTKGDKEILLVVLGDGRFIAITPKTLVVQALAQPNPKDQKQTSEVLTLSLLELSNTLDLGGDLDHVSLDCNGWHRGWDWTNRKLGDGLKSTLNRSYAAGGDVEILDIEVSVETTQQVLLSQKMHDTTDPSSASIVLRAMALSKSGKHLAVISGNYGDVETASIRSGNSDHGIPLRDFLGVTIDRQVPDTIDHRGAAFSSSGNILAICENPNVVGFWRTSDGELIGRVVFQTAARGCVVDGATGLPPELVIANSGEKDGWIVEDHRDKLPH